MFVQFILAQYDAPWRWHRRHNEVSGFGRAVELVRVKMKLAVCVLAPLDVCALLPRLNNPARALTSPTAQSNPYSIGSLFLCATPVCPQVMLKIKSNTTSSLPEPVRHEDAQPQQQAQPSKPAQEADKFTKLNELLVKLMELLLGKRKSEIA